MLGVASLNFNIWNRLESHGIACSKHALHSPEEKCEQFHRPSSSAGAGLVNMVSNVVLTLSRNQPISRAQSPVLPFVLARLERLNAKRRSGGALLEARGLGQREVH